MVEGNVDIKTYSNKETADTYTYIYTGTNNSLTFKVFDAKNRSGEAILPVEIIDVNIVGTWIYKSVDFQNCTNSADNGFSAYATCTTTKCDKQVFNGDGTYAYLHTFSGFTDDSDKGTYTKTNTTVTTCHSGDCAQYGVTYTFTINGSLLTLKYKDSYGCDVTYILQRE